MKSNYDTLGKHIRLVDERNTNMETDRLLGINIDKYFMPSVANIIGTDLSKYKLIRKGRFACNPMHVGRDERLPVALYTEDEPSIISPAYFIFEIINESVLMPEYLMMWFLRAEFDRICWLKTDGSVRGGITWDDIGRLELPIPPLDKQKTIVKAYQAITDRIVLKRKINDNFEAVAEALYSSWFIINEPFKINGDLPSSWRSGAVGDVITLQRGHDLPKSQISEGAYPVMGSTGVIAYHNQFTTKAPVIAMGRSGNIGNPRYYNFDCWAHNTCLYVKEFRSTPLWAFYMLKHINYDSFVGGSAVPTLNRNDVHALKIVIPPNDVQDEFSHKINYIIKKISRNQQEIAKLGDMQDVLLSRMAIDF